MPSSTTHTGSAANPSTHPAWSLKVMLKLGRVSNLPTVWTNVLAALILSGGHSSWLTLVVLLLAMSCAYVGGMFLNDACDEKIDASERPERPIPSGQITARQVFVAGFCLLMLAMTLTSSVASDFSGTLSCAFLCVSIVVYNLWHKGNPLSPVLMGICRCLVYVTCALASGTTLTPELLAGALVLLSYLIALTYSARHESSTRIRTLWPLILLASPLIACLLYGTLETISTVALAALVASSLYAIKLINTGKIGVAVSQLIAGICLVDGLLIAIFAADQKGIAPTYIAMIWALCVASYLLTTALQRHVAGT